MRLLSALLALIVVSGCVSTPPATQSPEVSRDSSGVSMSRVVGRIEPVVEAACRDQLPGGSCDFVFFMETSGRAGVNAFQTLDNRGRPMVIVTRSFLSMMRSEDELAFVLGHEAAHHILQHIPQQDMLARRAALSIGASGRAEAVNDFLRFSQAHELAADRLGARLAASAGYSASAGATLIRRLPDPIHTGQNTHPSNAARVSAVSGAF